MSEELKYSNQIAYLRAFYPHKRIKIGECGVFGLDAVSNLGDLLSLIKNNNIKCAHCRKGIDYSWIVVFYNPRWYDKPISVLFFCDNGCAAKWNNGMGGGLIY